MKIGHDSEPVNTAPRAALTDSFLLSAAKSCGTKPDQTEDYFYNGAEKTGGLFQQQLFHRGEMSTFCLK